MVVVATVKFPFITVRKILSAVNIGTPAVPVSSVPDEVAEAAIEGEDDSVSCGIKEVYALVVVAMS